MESCDGNPNHCHCHLSGEFSASWLFVLKLAVIFYALLILSAHKVFITFPKTSLKRVNIEETQFKQCLFLVKIGPKRTNDDDGICLDFPRHFDKCVSSVDVETSSYVLIDVIYITLMVVGLNNDSLSLYHSKTNLLFSFFCWLIASPHIVEFK